MFNLQTKCAHCKSIRFEISLEEPEQSAFKLYFVRCAGCKNPIGALPYYDTNTKIDNLEKKLSESINNVTHSIAVIDNNIRILAQRR